MAKDSGSKETPLTTHGCACQHGLAGASSLPLPLGALLFPLCQARIPVHSRASPAGCVADSLFLPPVPALAAGCPAPPAGCRPPAASLHACPCAAGFRYAAFGLPACVHASAAAPMAAAIAEAPKSIACTPKAPATNGATRSGSVPAEFMPTERTEVARPI